MGKLPGYADVAAGVLPSANSTTSMNGSNYGLAANTNTKILYYNKTLLDANDLMAQAHVRHLGVTRDGKLVGVISVRDLVVFLTNLPRK